MFQIKDIARRTLMTAVPLLAAITGARGAELATDDPVAQITKVERRLEQIYNSPAFVKDPTIALQYFDGGPEMRLFDIMMPGEFRGENFRTHFVELGRQFSGTVEFYDLEVKADSALGYASLKQRFSGKDSKGTPFAMVMRVTDCFQKSGDVWKIVTEHVSLALDSHTFMKVIQTKH